jgi:hypothetical protein
MYDTEFCSQRYIDCDIYAAVGHLSEDHRHRCRHPRSIRVRRLIIESCIQLVTRCAQAEDRECQGLFSLVTFRRKIEAPKPLFIGIRPFRRPPERFVSWEEAAP